MVTQQKYLPKRTAKISSAEMQELGIFGVYNTSTRILRGKKDSVHHPFMLKNEAEKHTRGTRETEENAPTPENRMP